MTKRKKRKKEKSQKGKKRKKRRTSTLGTWRPIVFNVLRCMNND